MGKKGKDDSADLAKLAKAAREGDEDAVAAEADKLPKDKDGQYKI